MPRVAKRWHYKEILEGMYLDQGLTLREIASILGTTSRQCSPSPIVPTQLEAF